MVGAQSWLSGTPPDRLLLRRFNLTDILSNPLRRPRQPSDGCPYVEDIRSKKTVYPDNGDWGISEFIITQASLYSYWVMYGHLVIKWIAHEVKLYFHGRCFLNNCCSSMFSFFRQ